MLGALWSIHWRFCSRVYLHLGACFRSDWWPGRRKYTFFTHPGFDGNIDLSRWFDSLAFPWGYAAPIAVLILRLIQGLALGGEYGGAATYMWLSMRPSGKRGLYIRLDPDHGYSGIVFIVGCNSIYTICAGSGKIQWLGMENTFFSILIFRRRIIVYQIENAGVSGIY